MKPKAGTFEYEIERLLLLLESMKPESSEYKATVDAIDILTKAKEAKKKLSPDAMLSAGAQILCILLVLNYEQAHVLTTKALSMIRVR